MMRTFIRREKHYPNSKNKQDQKLLRMLLVMMDGNFDHPYAWNGMPEELLKEAKDLWKVN